MKKVYMLVKNEELEFGFYGDTVLDLYEDKKDAKKMKKRLDAALAKQVSNTKDTEYEIKPVMLIESGEISKLMKEMK